MGVEVATMATGQTSKTKTAAPAQMAAPQAQQPVQAAPTPKTVTGIAFAKPKAEKLKSTRPFCDHVYENGPKKGQRCSLRVQEGFNKCTNHVQAESKLTAEEAQALLALVGGLDDAQQIRLLTRALGWFKVKQLVSGKPEGDVLLNELVG